MEPRFITLAVGFRVKAVLDRFIFGLEGCLKTEEFLLISGLEGDDEESKTVEVTPEVTKAVFKMFAWSTVPPSPIRECDNPAFKAGEDFIDIIQEDKIEFCGGDPSWEQLFE